MAKGIHLFPYRTQKLSLSAPMVLAWRRAGRVGRCRIPKRNQPHECGVDFFLGHGKLLISPGSSAGECIHCTWLGFYPCAARWDRSRARPVGEAARRSVGNRKERLRDYASSPGRSNAAANGRERSKFPAFGASSGKSGTVYLARFPAVHSVGEMSGGFREKS